MNLDQLNASTKAERLDALRDIARAFENGTLTRPAANPLDVNNHIHTSYSFSPYSPTKAVYMSVMAGLSTCGIIDHDSISGAEEFIEAGQILGIPTTIGFEMRVDMSDTPFFDRRMNNPDQPGCLYVTAHAIPHGRIEDVKRFFSPINEKRGLRNRAIVEKINALFAPLQVVLDYDADVLPLSMAHDGGSVTERHVLFGLAHRLIERFGKGNALIAALEGVIDRALPDKIRAYLSDAENPHYDYDLLGALKAELVEQVYVPATDECIPLPAFIAFCRAIGALSCGAYLGDVGDSVTGDKKPQAFEDAYLDELFPYYAAQGLDGLSYMPSRNTPAQIARVQALCASLGLIQISGEDINQPRQAFICPAARSPEFAQLIETTWALIGSENDAVPIVSDEAKRLYPDLSERIAAYAKRGRALQ